MAQKKKVKKEKSFITSHDGHRLYYEAVHVPKPQAVLLFVHGLGEHCGRYKNPVDYFSKRSYTIYLFDQRGHGRSDGRRSFVGSFNNYLKDLDDFVSFVSKKEEGHPIFLVGHSMGGQIAINYAAKFKSPLSGLITSSANIQVAVHIPWLKKFLGLNLSRVLPKLSLTNEIDPKWISRDKSVVRAYKADPLVSKSITLKLASEVLNNQKRILKLAPKITIPTLLLHGGDDHICASEGSVKFYEKLGTKDKECKIYNGFYHEIFNELDKDLVFADMDHWLKQHGNRKASDSIIQA